jgi:hypothetical protein
MLNYLLNLYARFIHAPEGRDVYRITWSDGRKFRIIIGGGQYLGRDITRIDFSDYRTDGISLSASLSGDEWWAFLKQTKAVYLGQYCMVKVFHCELPKRLQ